MHKFGFVRNLRRLPETRNRTDGVREELSVGVESGPGAKFEMPTAGQDAEPEYVPARQRQEALRRLLSP